MIHETWLRLKAVVRRRQLDRDLQDELQFHLAMRGQDVSESSARPRFGNVALLKESCRDLWTFAWLETLMQDLRYGVRMLRRSPGFAIAATTLLALGIGANTAIFGVVDAYLLRLLPVHDPEKLVILRSRVPQSQGSRGFTLASFEYLRNHNRVLEGMFAIDDSNVSLLIDGVSEYTRVDFVSGNYHRLLGVRTVLGRTLMPDDDQPGKMAVAVISYGYWRRRFSLDPAVISKQITVKDVPCTIIGITPPDFNGLETAEAWSSLTLPLILQAHLALKDHDTFSIIGRLAPGTSLEQAQAGLDVLYGQTLAQQAASIPEPDRRREFLAQKIELVPGRRGYSDNDERFARQLRIIQAAAGLILLIACANLAGLLVARSTSQRKEFAIRIALGASRSRIYRQLLAQALLISVGGAAAGFLLARWTAGLLLSLLEHGSASEPFRLTASPLLIAFTAVLTVLTALLCSVIPAPSALRTGIHPSMKDSGFGVTDVRLRARWGGILVSAQIALSVVLLVSASLLTRSVANLSKVDFGFDRDHLLTMWIFPTLAGYEGTRELRLYENLTERLNSIPGVRAATMSRFSVLRNGRSRGLVLPSGSSADASEAQYVNDAIAPRFFETLGLPLRQGREFSLGDSAQAARVIVINEALARKYFPAQNAVGQKLGIEGLSAGADREIVGVVGNMRFGARDQEPVPAVYIPITQARPDDLGQMLIKIRTAGNPLSLANAVRHEVLAVDRNLPLVRIVTQAEETDKQEAKELSLARLLGAFGTLALLLAAVGLYGTLAYSVARRTHEIGIRVALGAGRWRILTLIAGGALRLTGTGLILGWLMSLGATRLISSFLFGVQPADPASLATAFVCLAGVTVAASSIPLWRAMKMRPMAALRCE